ncbi:restriction endonuclease [Brevundimonas diminuta]|uniref:restriction endonuclease n=1 Tax=Brevundimonas diminuta TaxID=293 RepID=UPI0022AF47ED|nr:restriction endonuclease [Brevundimonas diminuta]MCZ4109587.1 restriction endonuclease [Brevundimonas diminuta]
MLAQPCAGEPHFPFGVRLSGEEQGVFLHGGVRIESAYGWDGAGGRTDLHDIFGLLWAASLRATGAASSEVWLEPGVGGSPEVYSRFLVFNQPYGGGALSPAEGALARKRILAHTAFVAHDLLDACRFGGNRKPSWKDADPPLWVPKLDGLVDDLEAGIWVTRNNPDWEYFVDPGNAVSVVRLKPSARPILNHLFGLYHPRVSTVDGRVAIIAGGMRNSVEDGAIDMAVQIIQRVEGRSAAKWVGPASLAQDNTILLLPLESHCIFIGKRTIVALASPSGLEAFDEARQIWRRKAAEEAEIFNVAVEWRWSEKIDPARFEELVEALLTEEPGLQWVRAAGSAYDRDQGRDLVANWLTPPGLGQVPSADDESQYRTRRVIVQAKVRSKTVGKADVRDVRDTLDRHDAEGFLLVVHPVWSNDLYNYLETLARKKIWVHIWGHTEIAVRLRRVPHVAKRFADIVTEEPGSPDGDAHPAREKISE